MQNHHYFIKASDENLNPKSDSASCCKFAMPPVESATHVLHKIAYKWELVHQQLLLLAGRHILHNNDALHGT